jgi:hypothetical protein
LIVGPLPLSRPRLPPVGWVRFPAIDIQPWRS